MILFYGEGRLGNQIFQYQALNSIARPGETIVAVGLEELQQVFELHATRVVVIAGNLFIKRLFKFVINPLLLYPLSRGLRLVNYAEEPASGTGIRKGNSGELRLYRGVFASFTFVNGGYYQNPSLWKAIFPAAALRLNSTLKDAALQYLDNNVPPQRTPIFVHIRRGDYLNFSSYGLNDLALPETFYRNALDHAVQRLRGAWFVFVTDDPRWVAEKFADVEDKCIASFNARFDFSLMAMCRGGILSNSTYSLCAALMIGHPDLIIGPQYWFGFRINQWYPPRIEVAHKSMYYIPVLDTTV